VNVVALVKYVPNPSGIPPEIGSDFRLRRDGPEGGLDPTDEPGVELATQLTRRSGGTTTALTMGPERSVRALWRALALGADQGVAVVDDAVRGADALATAKVLAAAIRRQTFDLVIAGVESTDGATGTMPATLAELLGVPCVTFARALQVADGTMRIERQTGGGYDVLECSLPALVTVTGAVAQARHVSVRETIAAKKKPIESLGLRDLALSGADVRPGHAVLSIDIAPEREAGELIEDASEGPARIVELLRKAGVVAR
jgi:electron transfer flavoprotein beta subunit